LVDLLERTRQGPAQHLLATLSKRSHLTQHVIYYGDTYLIQFNLENFVEYFKIPVAHKCLASVDVLVFLAEMQRTALA
jgi:hypothetical protein